MVVWAGGMLKRGVRFWYAPQLLDIPVSSSGATKSPPLPGCSAGAACLIYSLPASLTKRVRWFFRTAAAGWAVLPESQLPRQPLATEPPGPLWRGGTAPTDRYRGTVLYPDADDARCELIAMYKQDSFPFSHAFEKAINNA